MDAMGIAGKLEPIAIHFRRLASEYPDPVCLELGTKQWEKGTPTHHKSWVPNAASYLKSDITTGIDVEAVSDAHALGFKDDCFDLVLAISVWEHLAKPWIAAEELARVLKPGGFAMIATHQTFPLHGYPHDYFRFSIEGLKSLFEGAGLVTISTEYVYPAVIKPPSEVTRWNTAAEAYLNVEGIFAKPLNRK